MSTQSKISVDRVNNALWAAKDSDFYSGDGKTWDQYANNLYAYRTSDEYRRLIVSEAAKTEFVPKDKELEFSDEFVKFILRVEDRVQKEKNAPITRKFKTMIPYSYEDPETGKRVKNFLDLKTASDYDLQSIVDDVPEARDELLYRSLIGENNNTNK